MSRNVALPPAPMAPPEYALHGDQVEPGAGYWMRCPAPSLASLNELRATTDDAAHPDYFPPYPQNPSVVGDELAELKDLAALRDEPYRIQGSESGRQRLPLSLFLSLRPQPLGSTINTARGDQPPVILTGRELARYFENETPGLAHRMALDFLIRNAARPHCDKDMSPPRQARIWAALDMAIYSALVAAWHYKWLGTDSAGVFRPNVSRRLRPYEYDPSLSVLFDNIPNSTFSGDMGPHAKPSPSPGTPRHPSYPSGHSTYSGAASEMLSYFFPEYRTELDRLADNIGMARIWAGIHWRSDHIEGMKLGRVVARLIIGKMEKSGVPMFTLPPTAPPSRDALERQGESFEANCGKATPKPPDPCA